MDVGRNLTLTSEQDTDNYDSKQQNASAGGSISMGGGSASVNLSKDMMHSTYESVQEQTGIFAGKGGFDITVGDHTQLNGAVIGSTGDASLNKLDTGTLGFSDIKNSAEYEVEHQSVGVSTGGNIGGQFAGNMANGLLVGVNGSGSDSSTTKAAISGGTIIVRDKDNQTQDVNDLSRDVEHANQTLSPIFDKEKEQQRLQEAQKIGEIGTQVMDIARTAGEIKGLEAAKAAHPELSGKALLETKEYKDTQKQYGTGSDIQQGISAATMALQGLAGGDMVAALAGGAAPYLAEVVKKATGDNQGANIIAHAVVNAALAAAQGRDAAAGAAGAAAGELAGMIALDTYGKLVSELTEQEKQKVLALSTLAAGLAGGLTGDSTADGMTGAIAGNTTVNNNLLGGGTEAGQEAFIRQHGIDMASCADAPGSASCQKAQNEANAVAGAMATAGLIYLPGGMQMTGTIGGSANAGIQYLINGEVNPTDVLIATYVGAFTANTGAWGTVGWNAAGGATSNYLKGDDPMTGAGWAAGGAALGYGIGKYVITAPLDKVMNPTWKNYKWVDMGMGISKPLPSSPIPGISGNGGAALSTETGSQLGPKVIDILEEKLK